MSLLLLLRNAAPVTPGQFSLRFYAEGADVNRVAIPLEDGATVQYPVNVGAGSFTKEMWVRCYYADNDTEVTDVRYSNILWDRDIYGDSRGFVGGLTRRSGALVAIAGHAGSGWDNSIRTTSNIGDGQWHHLAFVRDISTGMFYIRVDGVLEASANFGTANWSYPAGRPNGIGNRDEFLVIGFEKHDLGFGYSGWIDSFRVSNIARYLSDFTPIRYFTNDANTVGLYNFDTGAGTIAYDSSSSPTNGILLVGGTPSGPVWVEEDVDLTTLAGVPSSAAGGVAITLTAVNVVPVIGAPDGSAGVNSVSLVDVTIAPTSGSPDGSAGVHSISIAGPVNLTPQAGAPDASSASPSLTFDTVSITTVSGVAIESAGVHAITVDDLDLTPQTGLPIETGAPFDVTILSGVTLTPGSGSPDGSAGAHAIVTVDVDLSSVSGIPDGSAGQVSVTVSGAIDLTPLPGSPDGSAGIHNIQTVAVNLTPVVGVPDGSGATVSLSITHVNLTTLPGLPDGLAGIVIVSGALPPGLTFDSGTGIISGTPTTPGSYTFVVEATDSTSPAATGQRTYTIVVS